MRIESPTSPKLPDPPPRRAHAQRANAGTAALPAFAILMLLTVLLPACTSTAPRADYAQMEVAAVQPVAADIDVDLARLSEWFAGEWDNHQQVYEALEAATPGQGGASHERIHLSFVPVNVPALGGSVFYARQTLDDDPSRLFRLRLYRFAVDTKAQAIRLDQYSFVDEAAWRDVAAGAERFTYLRAEDLRYAPDCAVYFKYHGDRAEFRGETRRGACRIASERAGQAVIVEDRIELAEDRLWVQSSARDESGRLVYGARDGTPHKHHKVRYFEGFVVINRAGRGAGSQEQGWHTIRRILLHSEGRQVALTWDDGRRTGYSLQLARLPLQQGRIQVLMLKLIDDASQQTVSYAIGDAAGKHIGLNIQWFQSSFSEVEGDARFQPGR